MIRQPPFAPDSAGSPAALAVAATSGGRRRFVSLTLGATLLGGAPGVAKATVLSRAATRDLAMNHTHTRETIALTYAIGRSYVPEALADFDRFLRDHYSGLAGRMDPALYDLMHAVRASLKARVPFQIISGYRAPQTNEHLRTTRGGGVAKRSLHMDGKAVDVRLPGVPLAELRDAALALKRGGVGYYPGSNFVHLDTGAVRSWRG